MCGSRIRTQHLDEISQYQAWIVPHDEDEKSDVYDVVLGHEIGRHLGRNIPVAYLHVWRKPLFRGRLGGVNIEAIKLTGRRNLAGQVREPYAKMQIRPCPTHRTRCVGILPRARTDISYLQVFIRAWNIRVQHVAKHFGPQIMLEVQTMPRLQGQQLKRLNVFGL